MPEVHRHPDGLVYVRTIGATYCDTPDNFVSDFGEELPALPQGADEHIYTQHRRHCFMGSGDIIEGGPVPWDQGDVIIAKISPALAAKAQRDEAILAAADEAEQPTIAAE